MYRTEEHARDPLLQNTEDADASRIGGIGQGNLRVAIGTTCIGRIQARCGYHPIRDLKPAAEPIPSRGHATGGKGRRKCKACALANRLPPSSRHRLEMDVRDE